MRQTEGLQLRLDPPETNIVIFQVDPTVGTALQLVQALKDEGVLSLALGKALVRMVTHLHVTSEDAERAGSVLQKMTDGLASGAVSVTGEGMAY